IQPVPLGPGIEIGCHRECCRQLCNRAGPSRLSTEKAMPANRAYGMDQEFYPWSPIVTRPVLRWPDGARVALAVIVNLEHWDWEEPPHTPLAVSPLGGREGLWSGNQPAFPDIGGYGNHEYGNRVGLFSLLAALDTYCLTPT